MLSVISASGNSTSVSSWDESLQQVSRFEVAGAIQFAAAGNGLLATVDCETVGSLCFNSCAPDGKVLESQKEIFRAVYAEYKAVRENELNCVSRDFINAQYIEALKEVVVLGNGEKIRVEKSEQGNRLVHEKIDGQIVVEVIKKGESTECALQFYMRSNNLNEKSIGSRGNDSRSLGLVVKTGHSTICIGEAQEKASIQSVSKIFADIALKLCEGNLYRDEKNNEWAIFNINNTRFDVPSGYESFHREAHGIPVRQEYSQYKFNQRENLKKEREPVSKTTTYSIPNASNNYGALTTTGRIPNQAIIDGKFISGRSDVVKAVMEGILGYEISINEPVFMGELKDTGVEREKYLQDYKKYFSEKAEIQDLDLDWSVKKDLVEEIKLHMPDNFTRAFWLMVKGAFGEELKSLALTIKSDQGLGGQYTAEERVQLEKALEVINSVVEAYTRHCAFDVSCEDLASLVFAIASDGINAGGKKVFSAEIARDIIGQMVVGGLYDQSDQIDGIKDTFFNAIKSGVGGFLACAIPRDKMIARLVEYSSAGNSACSHDEMLDVYRHYFGEYGLSITTLARPLNEAGNSASGLELIKNTGAALSSLVLGAHTTVRL